MSSNQNPNDCVQIRLTRSALESLLTAQPELRVSLGTALVNEVAKRHFIKSVEHSELVKQAFANLNARVEAAISTQVGEFKKTWSGVELVKINPEFQKLVDDRVKQHVDAVLANLLKQANIQLEQRLKDMIDWKLEQEANKYITSKMDSVLKGMKTA